VTSPRRRRAARINREVDPDRDLAPLDIVRHVVPVEEPDD
jgi:hypothetical protein